MLIKHKWQKKFLIFLFFSYTFFEIQFHLFTAQYSIIFVFFFFFKSFVYSCHFHPLEYRRESFLIYNMRVCIFFHHWILSFRCSIELQINFSTNLIFIIFVLFNNFLKFLCDWDNILWYKQEESNSIWMAIWEGWRGSSMLWEHLKEINVNDFYVQMPFLNWIFLRYNWNSFNVPIEHWAHLHYGAHFRVSSYV